MYSKMEELDRLGGSGTNVRSGTDEAVWACCQNSAGRCSGRPGSTIAGPDRTREDGVSLELLSQQAQKGPTGKKLPGRGVPC